MPIAPLLRRVVLKYLTEISLKSTNGMKTTNVHASYGINESKRRNEEILIYREQ